MASISFPFVYFEKSIVPIEKAKVSIMTNALQYGTGVFGGIRGYWDRDAQRLLVFRPYDHIERFVSSLRILGVTIPHTKEELLAILTDLVKKNAPKQNVYFRPLAYAGSLGLSPNLAKDHEFSFAMYMIPLEDYLPTDKGLSVMISSWRRVSDMAIPARGKFTGAYMNSALARKEADDHGYDEAVVLTEAGHVAEGSAENIFIVKDGMLITPPATDDILMGITRKTILTVADDMGIPTVERSIDRSELYTADEAFFSGTGVQVAWIASVDKRAIGDGRIGQLTQKLRTAFFDIVYGRSTEYARWVMPIQT